MRLIINLLSFAGVVVIWRMFVLLFKSKPITLDDINEIFPHHMKKYPNKDADLERLKHDADKINLVYGPIPVRCVLTTILIFFTAIYIAVFYGALYLLWKIVLFVTFLLQL